MSYFSTNVKSNVKNSTISTTSGILRASQVKVHTYAYPFVRARVLAFDLASKTVYSGYKGSRSQWRNDAMRRG